MDSPGLFLRKLWWFVRRRKFQDELAEEMAFHRDQAEEQLRDEGIHPEAARYAVKRQFGNEPKLLDQSTEIVGFRFDTVGQDLRFALRQFGRNTGFAVTAILILALGLGASIAIFSFVDAALLKPLPYQEPARLVHVTESVPAMPHSYLSYPDYLDWKKGNKVFQSMDVWAPGGFLLATGSGSEVVPAARISDGLFHTLGVAPILGRDFYAGEDLPDAPRTVILSYAAWQKHFGGAADIIGKPVTLSGVAHTIVGVLPKDFQFALRGNAEFWTTLHPTDGCSVRRGCHNLNGIARLKDGVTQQAALANMSAIAAQLETQYPDSNRGQGASVESLSEQIVGVVRPIFLVLLCGAGLLLLIACVNVASLLLVRFESRRREVAVRGALGASRVRLVRQFITESLLLVAAATLLALGSAEFAIRFLIQMTPKDLRSNVPFLEGLGVNLHSIVFACVVATLAALFFSLAPVLRLTVGDELRADLNEGGRNAAGTFWKRFGSNLVIAELALAVVLLACAGLLGKSLYRLLQVDVGFQPDHLATVQVAAPQEVFAKDEQVIEIARQVEARAATIPGVQSASVANMLPVDFNGNTTWFRIVGRPYHGEHNEVNERDVSSTYIATIKASLIEGRVFKDDEDRSKPGVVLINQALARQYFPGEDPVGKTIGDTTLTPKSIATIIGVVNDIHEGPLDAEIWPAIYYPFNQSPDHYFTVLVRTSQPANTVLPTLVSAVHEVNPNLGTADIATMDERITDSPSAYLHRFSAYLIGGFALLALILGVVGLYGVVAYSVSQRTREIGVRMALGAQRGSVYEMVLKDAGRLIGFGVIAGLIAAVFAAMSMRSILFGVRSWDLPTLAAVAVVLGLAALAASFIPAHRAASVNPVDALRAE